MKYRPEIDGLRTIAVLPVVLFHAGMGLFSGGFVGVDVFFVISGYLITYILLRENEKSRISILGFYERRARRILPALAVMTAVCVLLAWVLQTELNTKNFAKSVVGVATFTANFKFWEGAGYFNEAADFMPLLHTWSLAVEEQFYIFFPVLLMVLAAFKSSFKLSFIVLGVLSFVFSVWAAHFQTDPHVLSASFFLLPARIWELILGSLAALAIHNGFKPKKGHMTEAMGLLGIALILAACFALDENTPFPGAYALIPTLGTLLVILFSVEGTKSAKLLSVKPMVFTGLVSYSFYLWHQPVFSYYRLFYNRIDLCPAEIVALVVGSFVAAVLSWHYVEKPFRNRAFMTRRTVLLLSLVVLLAMVGLGRLTVHANKGFEYGKAERLAHSDYIYVANMNDRLFQIYRTSFENNSPNTLAAGSSRLMQINTDLAGSAVLNMSVSRARLPEMLALIGQATAEYEIKKVYLGIDPWVFNGKLGLVGKDIRKLHAYWRPLMEQFVNGEITEQPSPYDKIKYKPTALNKAFQQAKIFKSEVPELNYEHEYFAKKTLDGRHIYDSHFAERTEEQIAVRFPGQVNFDVVDYEYSEAYKQDLMVLVKYLKALGIDVAFVLAPYHPELYKMMVAEDDLALSIEKEARKLAAELGINVIGSYDPAVMGCVAGEFYDGLHPDLQCMHKFFPKVAKATTPQ